MCYLCRVCVCVMNWIAFLCCNENTKEIVIIIIVLLLLRACHSKCSDFEANARLKFW